MTGRGALAADLDVMLLIDGTVSMENLFAQMKLRAASFCSDIGFGLAEKGGALGELKTKIIVFRGMYRDAVPFEPSAWFRLPEEAEGFRRLAAGIRPMGNGSGPRSGLEALSMAVSELSLMQDRARQIIVLLTDGPAHRLDDPRAGDGKFRPLGTSGTLESLHKALESLNERYRRLVIMAPPEEPWTGIRSWDQVHYLPCRAGCGIGWDEYDRVIETIGGSVVPSLAGL